MSGHSKWSTIKRKKGAIDAKRGKIFSRLAKQITVAAQQGKNLDLAIEVAKAANMPRDNIDRAIKKGTGELGGEQIEEVLYEAYGPGGAALLIEVLTDNKNRSLSELRAVLNKLGGTLAQPGAVQFLFDRLSTIEVTIVNNVDDTQLKLIEAGVDDVQTEEDRVIGYGPSQQLTILKKAAEHEGLTVVDARLAWIPKAVQPLNEPSKVTLVKLLESIDELDDVQAVETNAEL